MLPFLTAQQGVLQADKKGGLGYERSIFHPTWAFSSPILGQHSTSLDAQLLCSTIY